MNRKYFILKRKIPKAGSGWGSSLLPQEKKDDLAYNMYGDSFLNVEEGSQEQSDMFKTSSKNARASTLGKVSAVSGLVAGAAGAGLSNLISKRAEDRKTYTGFGDANVDAKAIKGQSALSGAMTGGDIGANIGQFIPIPGGKLIGRLGGMAVGAIAGLFGGKKKAEEAQEASNDLLASNMAGASRSQDQIASNAILSGEKGVKLDCKGGKMGCGGKNLGNFTLPKKKAKVLIQRGGGKLSAPGEVNVVVKGKLHKENNNLGNKDKGVPVVDSEGNKEYEVEAGEVIFRQDITKVIEDYAAKYKETGDEILLTELGETIAKELMENTQDNYGKFGSKVKNDEDKDRK